MASRREMPRACRRWIMESSCTPHEQVRGARRAAHRDHHFLLRVNLQARSCRSLIAAAIPQTSKSTTKFPTGREAEMKRLSRSPTCTLRNKLPASCWLHHGETICFVSRSTRITPYQIDGVGPYAIVARLRLLFPIRLLSKQVISMKRLR